MILDLDVLKKDRSLGGLRRNVRGKSCATGQASTRSVIELGVICTFVPPRRHFVREADRQLIVECYGAAIVDL